MSIGRVTPSYSLDYSTNMNTNRSKLVSKLYNHSTRLLGD